MRFFQLAFLCFCLAMVCRAEVRVTNVKAAPRWPWNGKVDVTFSIEGGKTGELYWIIGKGYDRDADRMMEMRSLSGDGVLDGIPSGGPYKVVWDAKADYPELNSSAFKVSVCATTLAPYMVVNLETWKVRYTSRPPNLDDDTCRTTELWLRRIPAGTFIMGSPADEVGRVNDRDMAQHEVTITQMFYIGVFEYTQRQWELVMGNKPSFFKNEAYYATRPVESVSYDDIRAGNWPSGSHGIGLGTFMLSLRKKTGLVFDLPTEAQWEYACRAGTTTALNSRKNLTNKQQDAAMAEVGRYHYNGYDGFSQNCAPTSGTAKVGSYLPNAWGLYDMHGNVWEWCLDRWGASTSSTAAETDPVGPGSYNDYYVRRGGNWAEEAYNCRSASRLYSSRSESNQYAGIGFRVVCLP